MFPGSVGSVLGQMVLCGGVGGLCVLRSGDTYFACVRSGYSQIPVREERHPPQMMQMSVSVSRTIVQSAVVLQCNCPELSRAKANVRHRWQGNVIDSQQQTSYAHIKCIDLNFDSARGDSELSRSVRRRRWQG